MSRAQDATRREWWEPLRDKALREMGQKENVWISPPELLMLCNAAARCAQVEAQLAQANEELDALDKIRLADIDRAESEVTKLKELFSEIIEWLDDYTPSEIRERVGAALTPSREADNG
jgi:hypothetical protein